MRVKSANQFNGLTIDVRGTIQKIRDIVVRVIRANGAGRDAGKARLAKFRVEQRNLANANGLDRTDAETCSTI